MRDSEAQEGGPPTVTPTELTHSELSGAAGHVVQAHTVSGGVHFLAGAPESAVRPAQLPAHPRDFVNREHEVSELDELLEPDGLTDVSPRVAAVVGTAGVGKTALAVRWARAVLTRFPDGQLFANLRGYDAGPPLDPTDVLWRFLRAWGIPGERIPNGEDARADLFRSVVAERRVFILLDNAFSVAQVRPLLPGGAQCMVLVTSRDRLSGLVAREGARRVSVEVLSPTESVRLLRTLLADHRTDDDTELAELARLCACLPLALRIAAERAVGRRHTPLRVLIAELRTESDVWDVLSAGEADAVSTVFAWSYRALAPEVGRMFRLLGLHPGLGIGIEAAAALADVSPTRARRLLDTLAGAHLVEECGYDRYQFHDLLRAFAREQAQRQEPAATRSAALGRLLRWYLHAAALAARAGSGAYSMPVALEPLDDGVATPSFADGKAAIAWFEAERDNLVAAVTAAGAARLFRVAWQIPAVLTMVIADREPPGTWLQVQRAALEAARAGQDRYGEAVTLDNLGIAYRHLFDLAPAEEAFRAALTAFQGLGDEVGQARAANGLGMVYLYAHRLDEAAICFEQALSVARSLEHPAMVGFFGRNLGRVRLESGDLARAEPVLTAAAQTLREQGEWLDEAEALTLLAALFRQSGRLDQAQAAAERALTVADEYDGTLFEGLAMLELGRIETAHERPAEALGWYQQAAALFDRVGRPEWQAAAWDATGDAYTRQDRADEAIDFHRQAAARHRLRGDTWRLALSLRGLAEAHDLRGDVREARERRRDAAELLSQFTDPVAVELRATLS